MDSVQLSIHVEQETFNLIKEASIKEDRTISAIVRRSLKKTYPVGDLKEGACVQSIPKDR